MKQGIKIVLFVLLLVGLGYLVSKFPDISILIIGIILVIIVGNWMLEVEPN